MDPISIVGLVASIVQVIGSMTTVLGILNDIKSAPKERSELALETTLLLGLLTSLRYRLEDSKQADPWFTAVRSLGVKNGPLEQLQLCMVDLAKKLGGRSGLRGVFRSILWTLDRQDVFRVLNKIERLKSTISLVLEGDIR